MSLERYMPAKKDPQRPGGSRKKQIKAACNRAEQDRFERLAAHLNTTISELIRTKLTELADQNGIS